MQIDSWLWSEARGWEGSGVNSTEPAAQLVLVFGARSALERPGVLADLRRAHPRAEVVGCSSAGEIHGTHVLDDSILATAIRFEATQVRVGATAITDTADSRAAGERLAAGFPADRLRHVIVLADGLGVNGSALAAGMKARLPEAVAVTGGLAGDGERFERTLVVLGDEALPSRAVAIALYGDAIRVGYGSMGGWDTFGPERLITRSSGNVLFELDGEPALDVYSRYLGHHAAGLPASGLLFPLSLRVEESAEPVVRTIVGIDRDQRSLTFVGEIPEGAHGRLMRANLDRLIDGASGAAERCHRALGPGAADLALLISCVGRRLVLKHRIEEEIENVSAVLGQETVLCGFYSYGEIAPFVSSARCELHNQTMTITTLAER